MSNIEDLTLLARRTEIVLDDGDIKVSISDIDGELSVIEKIGDTKSHQIIRINPEDTKILYDFLKYWYGEDSE